MAKLNIKKMRLIFLQKDSRGLLGELQRLGAAELTEFSDERLYSISAKSSAGAIERNLRSVEECLEIMNRYSPPKGGLASMFSGRREISAEEYGRIAESSDDVAKIASEVVALSRSITEMNAEMEKCETGLEMLSLWEGLDIPMQKQKTAKTVIFTGTFPELLNEEKICAMVDGSAPDAAYDVSVIGTGVGQTAACIIVYAGDGDAVWNALRGAGFTKPADPTRHPPDVRQKRYRERIGRLKDSISDAEKKIKEAVSHREAVQFLADYLAARRDEYAEIEKLGVGDTVMVAEGYICEGAVPDAEAMVSKYTAAVEFFDPAENEDVPVVLKNGTFSEPMEAVVEMYSMPGKRDIDPSSVMAFFYYLLFGMMLSDAGYGVLMTVFSAVVLKCSTVEGSMRRMLKMFLWSGISTIVWGLLFGSIFGDIIPVICTEFLEIPAPDMALWFTPIDNAILLLVFSLGIGICHMLLGLITATVVRWRMGERWDAVLDNIPVILLLIGVAPLGATVFITVPGVLTTIGTYIAVLGVVGIVAFSSRTSGNILARIGGGLYALYNNVSGYLSDILSYSRLLALGLATGSIAEVINMMGVMPEGKVPKAIVLGVVFIIGHSLNMAINLLGAYVHTMRLQFVELFPKFYEGGGRMMRPFAMNTKYFKIRKEARSEKKAPSDG